MAMENGAEEIVERSLSDRELEYSGWVYHLGVNSVGYEYCHLRFLYLRGKYVAMFKRDPHENPGIVSVFYPSEKILSCLFFFLLDLFVMIFEVVIAF